MSNNFLLANAQTAEPILVKLETKYDTYDQHQLYKTLIKVIGCIYKPTYQT